MSSNNTLTSKENSREELGLRARFKKKFLPRRDKSVDRGAGVDIDRTRSSSSKSVFKSSDTTARSPAMQTYVDASKPSPREVAEVEFRKAAINLNSAMAKSSSPYQIPEAIALQTVDHVTDVEATCDKLETAIDKFIHERTSIAEGGRQVWKECVKSWYCALFPYVKPCLSAVAVNICRKS
jgi:hypothetical protein